MSIEYIRKTYNVPAKIGGELNFTNCKGVVFECTIFSTIGSYLKVRYKDAEKKNSYLILHPTYNIEYQ